MPSAPPELRAEWHGRDADAEAFLRSCGWRIRNGVMQRPPYPHVVSPRESRAADYLWLEWDYCEGKSGER